MDSPPGLEEDLNRGIGQIPPFTNDIMLKVWTTFLALFVRIG